MVHMATDVAYVGNEHLWLDAACLAGLNVLLWLVSLRLGKCWPVDFIWSGWPPVLCAIVLAREPVTGALHAGDRHQHAWRRWMVCALVAAWGVRLTANFLRRGGVGHEDWRYANMRRDLGSWFPLASLFCVFLGQSLFLGAACLPLPAALLSERPVDASDGCAVALCAGSILCEAVADRQMDAFQAARRAKRIDAVVVETGLWAWSRHPNYLGELGWWWGVWLFGAAEAPPWVLAGPVSITLLFCGVSVELLEARQRDNKGDAYARYASRVPARLLLVPPPVGRWLGRTCGAARVMRLELLAFGALVARLVFVAAGGEMPCVRFVSGYRPWRCGSDG